MNHDMSPTPSTDDPKAFHPSVIISFRVTYEWWLRIEEQISRAIEGLMGPMESVSASDPVIGDEGGPV